MNQPNLETLREIARAFGDRVHCADCNSDAVMIQRAPGVYVLEIAHDETCPQWQAIARPA